MTARGRRGIEDVPAPLAKLLMGYRECQTTTELFRWENRVIDEVLAWAMRPDAEGRTPGEAPCPLCGWAPHRQQGFTLPEGRVGAP